MFHGTQNSIAAKWRNLDAGYGYANAKKGLGVMYVTLVPLRNGEFLIMDYTFLIWAFLLRGLSAASLPLGSLLGIVWRPQNKIIGMMTAFGGGALLAALAIELVAPTAMHLSDAKTETAQKEAAHHLINLMIGAISGGIVFILLDEIINSKGGFLRKTSSTIEYFTNRKAARRRQILEHLSVSELIRHLPLEAVEEMVSRVTEKTFNAGEIVFEEGTDGDTLIFLEAGRVTVKRGCQEITTLKGGDVLGEIALVTGARELLPLWRAKQQQHFPLQKMILISGVPAIKNLRKLRAALLPVD